MTEPMSDERRSEVNLELLRFSGFTDPPETIRMLLEMRNEVDRLRAQLAERDKQLAAAEAVCVALEGGEWAEGHAIVGKLLAKWQSLRGGDDHD